MVIVEILAQINKPFAVVSALQSVWFIYTALNFYFSRVWLKKVSSVKTRLCVCLYLQECTRQRSPIACEYISPLYLSQQPGGAFTRRLPESLRSAWRTGAMRGSCVRRLNYVENCIARPSFIPTRGIVRGARSNVTSHVD